MSTARDSSLSHYKERRDVTQTLVLIYKALLLLRICRFNTLKITKLHCNFRLYHFFMYFIIFVANRDYACSDSIIHSSLYSFLVWYIYINTLLHQRIYVFAIIIKCTRFLFNSTLINNVYHKRKQTNDTYKHMNLTKVNPRGIRKLYYCKRFLFAYLNKLWTNILNY